MSASSSSASVPMVPGTRTPAAVVSLTPMCRLLLPRFNSSRWAKSASFGSAEATVAHRRPPSPPASPACPPSPPRVGGTPQVRAPVCRAPGPLSLYHLASAQPISPPPIVYVYPRYPRMVMNCPFDSPMPTSMLGTSPLGVRVSAEDVRPRRDSAACIVRPDAAAPLCVSPRLDYPAGRKSLIWCLLLLVQCGRHGNDARYVGDVPAILRTVRLVVRQE